MVYIRSLLSQVVFFVSLLLIPSSRVVFAQSVPQGRAISVTEILDLAKATGGFLYVLGWILAVIAIILSGIMYIIARGDVAKVKAAKDTLRGGIIGAAIIFAVGIIVNTLQALITNPSTFFGF